VVLEEAFLGGARAPGASFARARLTHADLSHADVSGADFSDAELYRTKLHAAVREGARLSPTGGWLGDDEELRRVERWKPRHGAEQDDDRP
jgi:hypothetical protein